MRATDSLRFNIMFSCFSTIEVSRLSPAILSTVPKIWAPNAKYKYRLPGGWETMLALTAPREWLSSAGACNHEIAKNKSKNIRDRPTPSTITVCQS